MNELPLLPSERKELLSKIKELNNKYEMAYSSALRSFTRIINEDISLTQEQREGILESLWKGMENKM
jgi:hypothetical protein